jgi:hypothetical protein
MQMILFFFTSNSSSQNFIMYLIEDTYYCTGLFARAYKHNQKHLQLLQGDPNSQVPSYKHVHLHHEPYTKQSVHYNYQKYCSQQQIVICFIQSEEYIVACYATEDTVRIVNWFLFTNLTTITYNTVAYFHLNSLKYTAGYSSEN